MWTPGCDIWDIRRTGILPIEVQSIRIVRAKEANQVIHKIFSVLRVRGLPKPLESVLVCGECPAAKGQDLPKPSHLEEHVELVFRLGNVDPERLRDGGKGEVHVCVDAGPDVSYLHTHTGTLLIESLEVRYRAELVRRGPVVDHVYPAIRDATICTWLCRSRGAGVRGSLVAEFGRRAAVASDIAAGVEGTRIEAGVINATCGLCGPRDLGPAGCALRLRASAGFLN